MKDKLTWQAEHCWPLICGSHPQCELRRLDSCLPGWVVHTKDIVHHKKFSINCSMTAHTYSASMRLLASRTYCWPPIRSPHWRHVSNATGRPHWNILYTQCSSEFQIYSKYTKKTFKNYNDNSVLQSWKSANDNADKLHEAQVDNSSKNRRVTMNRLLHTLCDPGDITFNSQ